MYKVLSHNGRNLLTFPCTEFGLEPNKLLKLKNLL